MLACREPIHIAVEHPLTPIEDEVGKIALEFRITSKRTKSKEKKVLTANRI